MTVVTVKARLALIQESITGIKKGYAQPPNSLVAGNLPAIVNFTGPATQNWVILGSDMDYETRTYLMRLYVMPYGTGAPGEAERQCEPFFDRIRDTFGARPNLENLSGILRAALQGDNGVQVLPYQGQLFWGVEFRELVEEMIGVTYVDY